MIMLDNIGILYFAYKDELEKIFVQFSIRKIAESRFIGTIYPAIRRPRRGDLAAQNHHQHQQQC